MPMFNLMCQWLINTHLVIQHNCQANTGRFFLETIGLVYNTVMLDSNWFYASFFSRWWKWCACM